MGKTSLVDLGERRFAHDQRQTRGRARPDDQALSISATMPYQVSASTRSTSHVTGRSWWDHSGQRDRGAHRDRRQ
jgi:hypothetical protein